MPAIRLQYTPRWLDYYNNGLGSRPSDSRWREFHSDVDRVFFSLCAYCEELCRGEVEHFRPKSRFPQLVYEWSNWVFACHDCNHLKSDNWPSGGYIDPCAKSNPARPDNYFDFDTLTGEVIPKSGLTPTRLRKARQMIDDLRLNESHHLKKRLERLELISRIISGFSDTDDPIFRAFAKEITDRGVQLSSIVRTFLAQNDHSFDGD